MHVGSSPLDALLGDSRKRVRQDLQRVSEVASSHELTTILGVRGALLERYRHQSTLMTTSSLPVLPAWQRYQGVVWRHLEPHALDSRDLRRILVPSGLYGVTFATDSVVDYRLKMSVKLPSVGRLDTFWRHQLSEALGAMTQGSTVVDLLPLEHARAVDWTIVKDVEHVRVTFETGRGRAVGHDAKAVKGVLARDLLLRGVDGMRSWNWRGWRLHRQRNAWRVVSS